MSDEIKVGDKLKRSLQFFEHLHKCEVELGGRIDLASVWSFEDESITVHQVTDDADVVIQVNDAEGINSAMRLIPKDVALSMVS